MKKEKGKQRAPVEDENDAQGYTDEGSPRDDEQDVEGQVDDEEHNDGSPRGHKRARVNDDGDSRAAKKEGKGKGKARVTTLPRDVDG